MKTSILEDYQKWKELNKGKEFSLYDYIFHMMNSNNVNSDLYFAFLELFWPSFIVYKDYILLKENFSEERIDTLLRREEKIEFWINLLLTDPYFENDEDGVNKAKLLAYSLLETWSTKLKQDFPDKDFIVEYVSDEECGDQGLTFYQKRDSSKF